MQFCHREEPGQQQQKILYFEESNFGTNSGNQQGNDGNLKHHGESERQPREKNKLQLVSLLARVGGGGTSHF